MTWTEKKLGIPSNFDEIPSLCHANLLQNLHFDTNKWLVLDLTKMVGFRIWDSKGVLS